MPTRPTPPPRPPPSLPPLSPTPQFVERLKVSDIITPPVRHVSMDERVRRQRMAASLAVQGGASSSEDSGDEAYAARHAPLEGREKRQYMDFVSSQVRGTAIVHGT